MARWILALDIGGTKLTAALISETVLTAYEESLRKWTEYERFRVISQDNAQDVIQAILSMSHKISGSHSPDAIGVSFGGLVGPNNERKYLSHHVPGWQNISLTDILSKEFNASIYIDNDANLAALGEHRFGAGRGMENLLYITVSTGVGGGLIINGQLWRGSDDGDSGRWWSAGAGGHLAGMRTVSGCRRRFVHPVASGRGKAGRPRRNARPA